MLREIPAESGSSSMHPMLYLCAATGLTFDACIDFPGVTEAADLLFEYLPSEPFFIEPLPHTLPEDLAFDLLEAHGKTVAEVNDARQLVRARLGAIRQRMPQRVKGGMLQLVEARWLEHDATQAGSRRSHWFDVWTRTGLGVILS
ncbi:hypothetical protein B0T11DRAFT_92136 [Plectosphaerella cucumerina]|uniref:Uncharacterized protein n=1 Tax=Plectosphaerella cucumerina TaxID=40658 RepID=A0A8K0X3Z9_9PEZI|nr:hypothetical protein B0T11DRAFT_92136 [Plectosphaerella cucumerina]